MRRRRQTDNPLTGDEKTPQSPMAGPVKTGLVLSGGGSRAAYQIGALKALAPYLEQQKSSISIIMGSSIGAINGLVIAAGMRHGLRSTLDELDRMWRKREFRNTFTGSPSQAFFRAIRMAVLQYLAPGPNATSAAVFDPSPLMREVDDLLKNFGGVSPRNFPSDFTSVGVMTTVEGKSRKPLLFASAREPLADEVLHGSSFEVRYVDELSAKHGFASAALPSVLPPVELDLEDQKVRLVDGGISQNIPVDPTVRFGADQVIVVDVSGRNWWLDQYGEAHDKRPTWEVPADFKTFCFRPPETFVARCRGPLGPILRSAVRSSRGKFMRALGPVWPVFTLLRTRLGEDVAYEAMSYVALDPDYLHALIEAGFNETLYLLRNKSTIEFKQSPDYEKWANSL